MPLLDPKFDSAQFLNIHFEKDTKKEDIDNFKKVLNIKIAEYVLIKLTDHLSDEQARLFLHYDTAEDKLKFLNENIPDLEGKIEEEMEQFKRKFQNG